MNHNTYHPDWLLWPQTQKLVAAFDAAAVPLRFVGGAVRDALLKRPVKDVDAATTALPPATISILEKAGIRAIPTGIAHGTVTALIDGKSFEVTTLRKDLACDGRHAEVAFTDDWQADAARRDFTMNALYLSPAGELFDYFHGQDDALGGRVRFIGEASERIREDTLRILRFFRFHARYGIGVADADALRACRDAAEQMANLSGERIREELFKLLSGVSFPTVTLMQESAILRHALGFTVRDCTLLARMEAIESLALFALPPLIKLLSFVLASDSAPEQAEEALVSRLRLSHKERETLSILLRFRNDLNPDSNEAGQKRLIRALGAVHFEWLLAIVWAAGQENIFPGHRYKTMQELASRWQIPDFPVRGDDLIALGMTPGKDMGIVLRRLEEIWESSGYRMDKQALLLQVKA